MKYATPGYLIGDAVTDANELVSPALLIVGIIVIVVIAVVVGGCESPTAPEDP